MVEQVETVSTKPTDITNNEKGSFMRCNHEAGAAQTDCVQRPSPATDRCRRDAVPGTGARATASACRSHQENERPPCNAMRKMWAASREIFPRRVVGRPASRSRRIRSCSQSFRVSISPFIKYRGFGCLFLGCKG